MPKKSSNGFEDIKSTSKKSAVKNKFKSVSDNYGRGLFKNMGNIVKIIAFMVSAFVFLVFAAGGVVIYMLDAYFLVVSIAVVIFGVIAATITLFLIYAIGHLISQNNEILRRLDS